MSDVLSVDSHEGEAVSVTHPTFQSFPISDDIKSALAEMGFEKPTEVQREAIEPALSGHDLLVQSRTGSGKTSAFGIPLIERLPAHGGEPGQPLALILAPTRELAHQVASELRALAAHKGTRVHAIYGGVPMGRQIAALRSGLDVVVGTPGRLLDHIRRKNLSLAAVRFVVLDEADEMLSMGFWDEVTGLLELTPKERQTMLFSATLPYEVAKAASQYLREPVRIDLSGDSLTVEGIDSFIYHVQGSMPKPRQLMYVLEVEQPESAIIFCNTRNETDMIAKYLTTAGFVAEALSGNLKQRDRERVMARIKARDLRYMVATDIAARGIDINNLSHVFNYSLPEFTEVYLHRVGRTGRIGKLGTAVSLVDGTGLTTLTRLQREFGIHFVERRLPPEEEVISLRSHRIMKELAEKASVAELGQHLPVAQEIVNSAEAQQIVAFLLKSYFGAQAAEGERRGHSLVAGKHAAAAAASGAEPAAGETVDEAGRRRRRRRRRRGRPERSGGEPFETIDAADVLAQEAGEAASGNGSAEGAEAIDDGLTRIRVNIGFDDGFKGRGAVAKKISALAGLNEGIVTEVESRRDHSVLKATPEIAELLIDRVDGAPIGKKILTVSLAQ